MEIVEQIRQYIGIMASMRERAGGGNSPEGVLRDYGQEFGPQVDLPQNGEKQECYSNAYQEATSFRPAPGGPWYYAEGYAAKPQLPIPIQHAWLVNNAGEVFDPTPGWGPDTVYFGIAVQMTALIKSSLRSGYYCFLWPNEMVNRMVVEEPVETFLQELNPGAATAEEGERVRQG